MHVEALYIDSANQLARAAVDVDARFGRAGPTVGVQLLLIAVDGCSNQSSCPHVCAIVGRRWDVPTYSTAVRRPHHIVVLELEVLVKDSLVKLHFPVELVADLLPVGCWLGHGWSLLSGYHGANLSEAWCACMELLVEVIACAHRGCHLTSTPHMNCSTIDYHLWISLVTLAGYILVYYPTAFEPNLNPTPSLMHS